MLERGTRTILSKDLSPDMRWRGPGHRAGDQCVGKPYILCMDFKLGLAVCTKGPRHTWKETEAVTQEEGGIAFRPVPPPSDAEVVRVTQAIVRRVSRLPESFNVPNS